MSTEKNHIKRLLIIYILWLIIINIFALLGNNRLNLKSDTAYTWINPNEFTQIKSFNPVSLHIKWDSFWYLDIAQNGYSFKGPEKLSNVVFFPLYPFLIRTLSFFFGKNLALTGWILSSFFLFLALFYFKKLIQEFHPEIDPYLSIFFLLIFPTAFFLNAVYTESIFLFFSITAFYHCLKKEYLKCGILGFFASLTRISGVLLFIPFLWEYLKDVGLKINSFFNKRFLYLLFIPLGTFSFFIYHLLKFNDFFLFFKVEKWWGRIFKINKDHFLLFSESAKINFLLDTFFIIFALILTIFLFKKFRYSYGLYSLSTIAVALSTGTFMSIGRYILILFPFYLALASIKNEYIKLGWIFFSILLLSFYIILFVNNYWAG